MKPIRVQRRRTKGFKLPENTVCVNRGTRWGNPFIIGTHGDRDEVIRKFEESIIPIHDLIKQELKGKNLACFCKISDKCHGDTLLRIANS